MTDTPAPTTEAGMEIGCPHNEWGAIFQCPVCGTPRSVTPARATPAEPLDVEALHKFLLTITDDTSGDWSYPGSRRELAREIVEYARLSSGGEDTPA